jgi:hypothetical protein
MIYSDFLQKTTAYLKSIRKLKNYISFDMIFPKTWASLKKYPESIEILQTETQDGIVTSFVCENKKENIDILEQTIDSFIKTNIEREEKEKLFKSKVQELKSIFESEKLENLKSLKFDVEDLNLLINVNGNGNSNGERKEPEKNEKDTKRTQPA